MGKMIDAQSIVVAGVATGQQGNEGEILRYIFWHSRLQTSTPRYWPRCADRGKPRESAPRMSSH